ncbi:venom serine protease 34-like isoform X2 [Linepithema humile]
MLANLMQCLLIIKVILFSILLLFLMLNEVKSDCNYFQNLETGRTYYVYNPGFPNQYKSENHCIWQIMSPYFIKINCTVNVPESYDCVRDSISVQFAGGSIRRYCGFGTFVLEGINATMRLDTPYYSQGGQFLCEIRTEKSFNEYNCQCGWKKQPNKYIVGGKETAINEYPMMCGLVDSINKILYCGCTIISGQYIVTAAHCVEGKNINQIGVIIGEHDVLTGKETKATRLYRMNWCKMHPNYYVFHNDIAVCKIMGIIDYSAEVGPVCLPFQHKQNSFDGSVVTALGWGLLEFGGVKSNTLQKVNLDIISLIKCKNYYPNVIDNNICTYTPEKDSCQMDSGGPILWSNPITHNLVLVGIISSGIGCASKEPAIHTRTGAFINWIMSVTPDVQYCKVE